VLLAALFHAFCRDDPQLRPKIDFIPARTQGLANPAGRQNRELEGARSNTISSSDLLHERWDLRKWQRRVMLDATHVGAGRQQVVEMPTPLRRVLALAIAACFGPAQHTLDPSPHLACCVWLVPPDGLKHFQHKSCIDGLHRQRAHDGVHICLERGTPLRPVLLAPPTNLVTGYESLGALLERHRLRGCCQGNLAFLIAGLDRVDAGGDQPATLLSLLTGFDEADGWIGTQPGIPCPARHGEAEDPPLGAARRHAQVQIAAVSDVAGPLLRPHRDIGKPVHHTRHAIPLPMFHVSLLTDLRRRG
jgi:hypothetical protein